MKLLQIDWTFKNFLKKVGKTIMSTSLVKNYSDKADQAVGSASQICRNKKKDKIKAQTKVIE